MHKNDTVFHTVSCECLEQPATHYATLFCEIHSDTKVATGWMTTV
jgi:hypothetical protein